MNNGLEKEHFLIPVFVSLLLFVCLVDTKTEIVVLYFRLLFSQAWEIINFISVNDGHV